MNYKEETVSAYEKHAKNFEESTKDFTLNYKIKCAELFIKSLPGTRILDLGSGPGRDSAFFKEKKLKPICLDISQEMVKLCRQKNLEAVVGDLENLPFQENSFDGVWAHTSLLHMPKKELPIVLNKIKNILNLDGLIYIGMKEGDFEGFLESDKYPGSKRFFALYSDKELREILNSSRLAMIKSSKFSLGDAVFLNYLCKK